MKIIPEIRPLAREHHQTLKLANRCIRLQKTGDETEIAEFCQTLGRDFQNDWQHHFEVEENLIFAPLIRKNTPLANLSLQLLDEHQKLLKLAKMLTSEHSRLLDFGILLKNHTRNEDREIFPFLQNYLSDDERKMILRAFEN